MSFLNCYETFHYFEKMFFIKSEPYTRALRREGHQRSNN